MAQIPHQLVEIDDGVIRVARSDPLVDGLAFRLKSGCPEAGERVALPDSMCRVDSQFQGMRSISDDAPDLVGGHFLRRIADQPGNANRRCLPARRLTPVSWPARRFWFPGLTAAWRIPPGLA